MSFFRQLITQSITTATIGATAALMAKLLGFEKSAIFTGMAGAILGWLCCLLYTSWTNTAETRTRASNDARLARAARQRLDIDNSIRTTMSFTQKSKDQREGRP